MDQATRAAMVMTEAGRHLFTHGPIFSIRSKGNR